MKDRVIENYQRNEDMMILIFAQWCINQDLNPVEVYEKAYPHQKENESLLKAIDQTVPKEESADIPKETVIEVLSVFGNEELAFVISELPIKK